MMALIYCAVRVDEERMPGNVNERLQSGVGGAPRSLRSGLGTLKCFKTCAEHAPAHSWGYRSGVVFKAFASRRRGEVSPRLQESLAEETQVQAAESLHHLASDGVRGTQLQLAAPSFQALITAWDHLAQRLPKQAGAQNAAGVILNALKLVFALSNSDSVQQSRDGTPAATPASTRTLALALQLADLAAQGLPLDAESIAAGIVADAVHTGEVSIEVAEERLGPICALLIRDMIKVRTLPSRCDVYDDVSTATVRELCLSFYDARAIVVEVCRRADDVQHHPSSEKWQRQLAALEALQIFAPMGHALGLARMCAELEDQCFQELFPRSYAETAEWLRRERTAYHDTLARCEDELSTALKADPQLMCLAITCQTRGRTKSLFSTMKKLLRLDDIARGGRGRGEVFDLLGLRVVVSPNEGIPLEDGEAMAAQVCYRVRQIAQDLWDPLLDRDKDYIAIPKANGYRSLHSTLLVPSLTVDVVPGGRAVSFDSGLGTEDRQPEDGIPLELQIRTARMHEEAQSGEAAHAAYKGGLAPGLARRLHSFLDLSASPPTLPVPALWNSSEAAAEELFRHLDSDGDGCLSVGELKQALGDLGFGQRAQAAAEDMVQEAAGKNVGSIVLADFLQFLRRAGALQALPELDRETAEDLRRQQQSHDHASRSGLDDRPYGLQREPSALMSQQGDLLERQHVLLRPVRLEKGTAVPGSAPGRSVPASIWDSYDADEEAAVLAMSSSPSIEIRGLSEERQSNSSGRQAQEARSGPAHTDQITSAQSKQHDSSKSSGQSERRGASSSSWEEDSSIDTTGESLTRRTEEDMFPGLPLFMDVTRVGLPPSMVPLEHPCHPWIRCSTFALIPKDLGGFCYVEDIQGRRLAVADAPIVLPQSGPLIIGATSEQDVDVLIDESRVSGRHARLEIVPCNGGSKCNKDYRVILTDLSSLNGTWVNRAKLRAHADSQIQAQDVITFGSSDATFQLVALDAATSNLPSALAVAEVMLEGAWRLPNHLESAATQHPDLKMDLLSQWKLHAAQYREATSRADQWKHLLQLANAERRLAKRGLQGNFARARAFYRAATEELKGQFEDLSSRGKHVEKQAEAQTASSGSQEVEQGGMSRTSQQHAPPQRGGAGDTGLLPQQQRGKPSSGSCAGLDASTAVPSWQSDLVRGLQSWARMEGFLGHVSCSRRLYRRAVQAAESLQSESLTGEGVKALLVWSHQEKLNGHFTRAHQIAKEALRADSSNSQSLSLIGTIEVSLKQFRAAQEHFRAGHELCPEDAKILGAWARMEAQCGNIQHARQLFQQAYDLGESNVILLQEWAVAETRQKNFPEARRLFMKALALNPRHVPAIGGLAHAEFQAGELRSAKNLYARALQVNPNHVKTLCALATLERRSSHHKAAKVHLRKALALQPTNPVALREMSIVQQATGEFSMASIHRREAAKNNKRSIRASTIEAPRMQS